MTNRMGDNLLINFLKRYRSRPPQADPQLESQIMAAIEAQNFDVPAPIKSKRFQQRFRLIPPAIAAGLLMGWAGYRLLTPAPALVAEEAQLEAFLVNNWEAVTGNEQTPSERETDWYPLAFPPDEAN